MASETTTSRHPAEPLSADDAWDALKRRRRVGQIVEGKVTQCEPYGTFLDVGERFPAFVDPLDLPATPFDVGDCCQVRILQFADYNRQIRVAVVDAAEQRRRQIAQEEE